MPIMSLEKEQQIQHTQRSYALNLYQTNFFTKERYPIV
jgi:hypothetical protein